MANAADKSHSKPQSKPVAPAKKRPTKKPKARNQPTKIDWEEAKRWYMDDARRSFSDVAKHFKVTLGTVKRHSMAEDPTWPEQRQDVAESQTETYKTKKQEQLEEADDRHLKAAKSAQNAAISSLYRVAERNKAAKDADPIDSNGVYRSISAMRSGIELERVILGLPILISRAETSVTEVTPPSVQDAEKALDKLEARRKRLRELRRRRPHSS